MDETMFFGLNWIFPHMNMGKECTFPSLKQGCKIRPPSTMPLTGIHDKWESIKNQKNYYQFEYSQSFTLKQQIGSAMVYSDCNRPPVLIGGFVGAKVHNSRQQYNFSIADLLSDLVKLLNTSEMSLPKQKSAFSPTKNDILVSKHKKHNLALSTMPLESNLQKATVLPLVQVELNQSAVPVQPVKLAATNDNFSNSANLRKPTVLSETVQENKDINARKLDVSKQSFPNQFCDREQNLTLDIKMPLQVMEYCPTELSNLLHTKEVDSDSNQQKIESEDLTSLSPSISTHCDNSNSHNQQRKMQDDKLNRISLEKTPVSKDSNITCTEVTQIVSNIIATKADDESICSSEMDIMFKIEDHPDEECDDLATTSDKISGIQQTVKNRNDDSPHKRKSAHVNFKPSCQNPLIAFILKGLSGDSDSEDEADTSDSDWNSTDASSFECDNSDSPGEDAESQGKSDFWHLSTNLSDSGTESDWDSSNNESANDYNEDDFQNECPVFEELMHCALDDKLLLLCDTYTKFDREDESDCKTDDVAFSENEMARFECKDAAQEGSFGMPFPLEEVNARWNSTMQEYNSCPKDRDKMKVSFAPEDTLVSVNCVEGSETLCRKGPWEEMALDRMRFEERIRRTEPILNACLDAQHRQKMYKMIYGNL